MNFSIEKLDKAKYNLDTIENYFRESADCILSNISLAQEICNVTEVITSHIVKFDSSVFWFGNGGSASDAEHLSAELSGRFAFDREPLKSFALTSNSSTVTAIANDYGFENIFSRQLKGSARSKDIAIGITTSGKSINVINGLREAAQLGCVTIALTGEFVEKLYFVDHILPVKRKKTCHIQESHIAIGQVICGMVEEILFKD